MISEVLPLIVLLAVVLVALLWRDMARARRDARRAAEAPPARPQVKSETNKLNKQLMKLPPKLAGQPQTSFRPEVLVDGSNVMHWKDNVAQLATLRIVVDEIAIMAYRPGVIFDASAGHKLFGRYRDDWYMAQALGLDAAQVLVLPKGEPADRFLLAVSRLRSAPIVTNDRYRDWVAEFPEVTQPGRPLRGGCVWTLTDSRAEGRHLWREYLDLDEAAWLWVICRWCRLAWRRGTLCRVIGLGGWARTGLPGLPAVGPLCDAVWGLG